MLTRKSIAIMNQFTNKNNSAKGSTPAKFVTNYMARNDATLTSYPVKMPDGTAIWSDSDLAVYQKQRHVLLTHRENLNLRQPTKKSWFNLTTLEGRAFDRDSVSLSKDLINERAQEMQTAFNQGHTVLKLVASFDNQYLKDLNVEKPKAYHFHTDVDEMKLRLAVQKGCLALSNSLGYTDPLLVGSIQLDRDHPHAHITLCETADPKLSHARRWRDGTEYGRITRRDRMNMRYAIDDDLELNKELFFFPNNPVEEAQHANEIYERKYAILPLQKKMLLYGATKTKSPEHDRLGDSLLADMQHFTSLSKRQMRNKLKTVEKEHHTVKSKKLPTLLALQLYSTNQLANKQGRSAKIALKLKKAKKKQQHAKMEEQRLKHELNYFENLTINDPTNSARIKQYIIPFYEASLINTAIELDQTRFYQFNKIKNVPKKVKKQYQLLKASQDFAQTSFEHDTVKQHKLDAALSWHQAGYVNSQHIVKLLRGGDDRYIPNPVNYALSGEHLNDPQFKQFSSLKAYRDALVPNAYRALKTLKSSRELQNNSLSIIQSTIKIKPKIAASTQEKTNVRPTKSVSYKQADEMLLDLAN